MKQLPILRATIVNGEEKWHGIDGKRYQVAKAFLEGKECEITIGPKRKKATAKQRNYYWPAIVAPITEAAGYAPTKENMQIVHEGLKWKFLRFVAGDGVLESVRSTESLTTVEKEEYHEHCRQFAAEWYGLYLCLPNEMPAGVKEGNNGNQRNSRS